MGNLPPHVGRPTVGDEIYSLTCSYTGVSPDGPRCGEPGATHVVFRNEEGEEFGSITCAEHTTHARRFGIVDEHPTEAAACAMPGAIWVYGPPSTCVLDDSPPEPQIRKRRSLQRATS